MTQTPEEWTIAALADRKSGIRIEPLRPAALELYQKSLIDQLIDADPAFTRVSIKDQPRQVEHVVPGDWHPWDLQDTVVVPSNGGYTYQRGVDLMLRPSLDQFREMTAQLKAVADDLEKMMGDGV